MTTIYNEPVHDPLRYCIFTTVALLAWVFGAPVAVTVMSGLGLWAYARAWKRGLKESRCFLRRPYLVMAYLAAAFALGVVFSIVDLIAWLR